MTALLVTLAGAAGVLSRYGLGLAFASIWTIAAINVAGSFLLGLLVGGDWGSAQLRTALGAGFLGGFTTFSTFSVQAVQEADTARALLYVTVSVAGGLMAAAAGLAIARA